MIPSGSWAIQVKSRKRFQCWSQLDGNTKTCLARHVQLLTYDIACNYILKTNFNALFKYYLANPQDQKFNAYHIS